MVDDTMGDKDNLEENTREDADIRMYYLGLNLFKDAKVPKKSGMVPKGEEWCPKVRNDDKEFWKTSFFCQSLKIIVLK